jgi:hypothetical protein
VEKYIFSVIAAASLAGAAPSAYANGLALNEQSASGLGNAFAGGGASAEDVNTIFFNPSGMTYLPDNQLMFVGHAIRSSADLGTVELENRFACFNKISDLQQKPAKEKKSKNDKAPPGKAPSGSIVDSADFIQDLEEIKKQKNTVNVDQQIATSSTFTDKWDRIANEVFGYANYDDYIAKGLKTTAFFGQSLLNLNDEMVQSLRKVEADLTTSQGSGYKAPFANSTLRKKTGIHGWGTAIDFDVEKNPYVLNENSEGQLNKELIDSYDNIVKLMLGKTQSDLRKLKSGRSAFGTGSIGDVYDVLREESDAMKRYFSLMNDGAALQSFIELEWTVKHPDQAPPDFAKTKAQMKDDYEVLGGKTDTGGGTVDRWKGRSPICSYQFWRERRSGNRFLKSWERIRRGHDQRRFRMGCY